MTKTNEPEVSTVATPATEKAGKLAVVKTAKATAETPESAPSAIDAKAAKPETGKKATGGEASYLAIALHTDLRSRLDATAKREGVSAASVIRKAITQHFNGIDNADAVTSGKVDQVQAGLDAALAKLARLDKAIDSALADTVRVADRLARVTGDKA